MRLFRRELASLTAALALVAGPACAQEAPVWRIGGSAGAIFFLSDLQLPSGSDEAVRIRQENAYGLGLEVGRAVGSRVELEAAGLIAPTVRREANESWLVVTDDRAIFLGMNVLYYFRDGPEARPFATAGVGTRSRDLFGVFGGADDLDVALNLGAGLEAPLSERWSVRLVVRDFVSRNDTYSRRFPELDASVQHDVLATLGAALRL